MLSLHCNANSGIVVSDLHEIADYRRVADALEDVLQVDVEVVQILLRLPGNELPGGASQAERDTHVDPAGVFLKDLDDKAAVRRRHHCIGRSGWCRSAGGLAWRLDRLQQIRRLLGRDLPLRHHAQDARSLFSAHQDLLPFSSRSRSAASAALISPFSRAFKI